MSESNFQMPEGLLLVDKPQGWTSFDVVAKVRGIITRDLKQRAVDSELVVPKRFKVGHTGTLDPLATGLLVLAVGKATKQIQLLTKLDKVYVVDAIFGAISTTGDAEGEITAVLNPKPPSKSALQAAVSRYTGEIQQIPPAYSAIKINGQRAYKLARAGKEVVLQPRSVTIHSIANMMYEWPRLSFTVHVSSGTYIRSLVEDIGHDCGSGAYMSDLRRTKVGKFELSQAMVLSDNTSAEDIYDRLISMRHEGSDVE